MSVRSYVEWLYRTARPLGEQSRYVNLGYWRGRPATLDEASEALAVLAGEAAGLRPGDAVLDAGCGFGDQDVLWARRFGPRRIVGINISAAQVAQARRQVDALGLAGRVEIRIASATEMPFPAASFDKVVALESALHFDPRTAFFAAAWRVLRGGGRLVTTDILPLPGRRGLGKLSEALAALSWGIPWANLYPRQVYAHLLRAAGFEDVVVTSIREHVFAPFNRHLARRLRRDPGLLSRLDPLFAMYWRASVATGGMGFHGWDYVLATARKPAAERKGRRGTARARFL
ncbi:MAG TPA: methyltransferase domain-containing protein [Thermoanaerobaculia bacterium]